ncbi:MAG: threonylcarbamoyl-AMP synthase [Rhizobiaceae bacterium]|nr:threonylcarbamoyl-AMP synthase [Rhizobiaceae bacterium]MCV0406200.1 threonylcarbamoyl-AMP synthase [Rhizobiaceae bacterium]
MGPAKIVPEAEALKQAVRVLGKGQPVAIPTETVYGLAADATDGEAVARIYETKGRPAFNPLIIHVASPEMAEELAHFDEVSRHLAFAFWPGPLTMVLPAKKGSPVSALATAGLETVAIRLPRGFARDLIAAFGKPIAAPSANSSGRISPTTAEAVAADLGDRIPLIVDGGPARVGVESTILSLDGRDIRLLRPGGLTVEDIRAAIGVAPSMPGAPGGKVEAPGQLASHYAPAARMRLDAASVRPGEALLGFGPRRARGVKAAKAVLNLSQKGDLREAAKNLFAHLAALDAERPDRIVVEPVPEHGLGLAINDRLRRAAAPRP